MFYVEHASGKTQWEMPTPTSSSSSPRHHTRTSTQLPLNWTKHDDDKGRWYYVYYVNDKTSESSWSAPSGATGGSAGGGGMSSYSNPMKTTTVDKTATTAAAGRRHQHHTRTSTQLPPDWNKHKDGEGRRYYSNDQTQESSWVAPEGSTGGSTGLATPGTAVAGTSSSPWNSEK